MTDASKKTTNEKLRELSAHYLASASLTVLKYLKIGIPEIIAANNLRRVYRLVTEQVIHLDDQHVGLATKGVDADAAIKALTDSKQWYDEYGDEAVMLSTIMVENGILDSVVQLFGKERVIQHAKEYKELDVNEVLSDEEVAEILGEGEEHED